MNLVNDFYILCNRGDLSGMIRFYFQHQHDFDISSNDEHIFRDMCYNGNLDVVQLLLLLKPSINISARSNQAFCNACTNGYFELAKLLFDFHPSVSLMDASDSFLFSSV